MEIDYSLLRKNIAAAFSLEAIEMFRGNELGCFAPDHPGIPQGHISVAFLDPFNASEIFRDIGLLCVVGSHHVNCRRTYRPRFSLKNSIAIFRDDNGIYRIATKPHSISQSYISVEFSSWAIEISHRNGIGGFVTRPPILLQRGMQQRSLYARAKYVMNCTNWIRCDAAWSSPNESRCRVSL